MTKQPALLLLLAIVCCATITVHAANDFSAVVIFAEPGFPAADTAAPSVDVLRSALPAARIASAQQLPESLANPDTRLLVLPYGSAVPESQWEPVLAFLQRGGNLVVIGGRPFTRAAYRGGDGWKLRDYSVRFARALMIDQYQVTPGSSDLQFQNNLDIPVKVPAFSWTRAFSPVIRLSAVDLYHRGGTAGSLDARLDPIAWGTKADRKMAAPVIEIDHLRNGFTGGRWIFVNAELNSDFYSRSNAGDTIRMLATRALDGAEEFTVRPTLPLYLPGEPVELEASWKSFAQPQSALELRISAHLQDQPQVRSEIKSAIPSTGSLILPAPKTKGLYIIDAELRQGETIRATYHSAFWVRDEEFLRSGPRMSVNKDYFELDGQPLAVIGTTYMSSEVQRLFFDHPNVHVWDQDLAQIHSAGLNMIRTGWWTGWDKLCDENGKPYDRTLRTLEAYLMTARKNGLPVQFNFLAFLPDVLGGVNPYLDSDAVRRQQTLISTVASRFHDVPWVAWDLINEPSISQRLWTMRPNGDPIELAQWNAWLNKRYPDRAGLAAAWNLPASEVQGTTPLPDEVEFGARGMYVGKNSLKVYDYFLFAQDVFAGWVGSMRDAIRATGSKQLITVGQDEGGIQDRLSPAYWGKFVDFTTNHSWWQNDYVLWDSFMAKQPGQTLLIQETGLQRELNLDESARRTPENEGALLERKIASSFVHGSGAIEWLWNTNSYMTESNETPIGAIFPDGTEKPEATVLRAFATFAKSLSPHLKNPRQAPIAIVTSQASQFSVIGEAQLEAQRKAVRALTYLDHLTAYAVAENQIEKLGSPKLVILPSPHALTDGAWKALLRYVNDGGNMLITGPVDYDEHWHAVNRTQALKIDGRLEPLTYHTAVMRLGEKVTRLTFNQDKQNWIDSLIFGDGSTLKEVALGKGRVFWASYPVEHADGEQPTAELYAYIATRVGIAPVFDSPSPLPQGVLVYPIELDDSVLYVMVSDAAEATAVDLRDKVTGARVNLQLPSQRAALAVVGKREKTVVAKYGF